MIGSDEGNILRLSDGKFFSSILGNVDLIIIGFNIGIKMGSLNGSFDGSNAASLGVYCSGVHWYLLMVKFLDMMKA